MKRVCLLLDNPLRDLDGIVLVACHLAKLGLRSYIVPMHLQGFEVPALVPDVLLANYVRRNNWDLLKLYRRNNIRIAVLDTEGTGEWWADYAKTLANIGAREFIDAYFCWGHGTQSHLLTSQALPPERIHVTGCPRYDFTSPAYRRVLETPDMPGMYVLVNTNFPILHPRFASNTEEEVGTWVYLGFDKEYAIRYAEASRSAYFGIKQALRTLAQSMPHLSFVIRPHPFERTEAYEDLLDVPNISIRQEGTSLKWLNHAVALLHLNCSTAIEANFLGVEAISFEWLNQDILLVSESRSLSRQAKNVEDIQAWLETLAAGCQLGSVSSRVGQMQQIVAKNYYKLDGRSAERVATELKRIAEDDTRTTSIRLGSIGWRQRIASVARPLLGYKIGYGLKSVVKKNQNILKKRDNKIPNLEVIMAIVSRIGKMSGYYPEVSYADDSDYKKPKLASGKIIRIG